MSESLAMRVFLLRHTEASYGPPDPERPLTQKGRADAARMAKFIKGKQYFAFDEIWCSPYLRARQTAEPFIESLKDDTLFRIDSSLTPGGDPRVLISSLRKTEQSILVVGHNPHLTYVARALLDPQTPADFLFKKGSLFVYKRPSWDNEAFHLTALIPASITGEYPASDVE